MWFAIIANDHPGSLDQRLAVRPAHLDRLNALQGEGRLLLAGPFPAIESENPGPAGFTGSLIIADFDDLDAARAWAQKDPYAVAGVYTAIDVRPFRKTLP